MTSLLATIAVLILAVAAVLGIPILRRGLVSGPLMRSLGRRLPVLGDTERIALEAGTVWWDGELFSGRPDWRKLRDFTIRPLSPEERAFLDGPTEALCRMLDDWRISQERGLPLEVWEFLRRERFLGLIIPREYGGLGFSARAHSAVVMRLSGRSVPAAVTVMVPNSLGPAELLLRYGTQAQKRHYLPRLASGEEIPCFALTEPGAGSDAAGGRSRGVVCGGTWQGEACLGMRLTFAKRYITLAPVATVIGLAFRLYDPDHLLGDVEDVGITCALIPRDTAGVEIGRRHDPMGIPFENGPLSGSDVFVPLDCIIGGGQHAGDGWRMVMESLAAGRGISLPSLAVATAQLALRTATAYAAVREQFGMPIGRFEGVRERLARIAGHVYLMDAARRLVVGAVDAGERPAVISATVKAWLTESSRICLADAMDVQAGVAICRGPGNILSRAHSAVPLGITVEGANILTRSLVVFGQGAIRCHPWLKTEMDAARASDLSAFDRALAGHLAHMAGNAGRLALMVWGGGRLNARNSGFDARYVRRLSRAAATFALVADVALIALGGALKRREYLSGRLADSFAWLVLASAALKRFHDDGCKESHRPLLEWTLHHALGQIDGALAGVLCNLPNRPLATLVRVLAFPAGVAVRPADDRTTDRIAESVLSDPDLRTALTADLCVPPADEPGLGILEAAFAARRQAADAMVKIGQARREGRLPKSAAASLARQAADADVICEEERMLVERAGMLADLAVQVGDFDPVDYAELR